MKTIGLVGGMSWESTQEYYRLINQGVRKELGGLHSAKVVINSIDFAELEAFQASGDWASAADLMISSAQAVEAAGADFVLLGANTMHKVAEEVEQSIGIPLIHIADATGQALLKQGITSVGLLGTAFTMEEAFYVERLSKYFGLIVLTPPKEDRERVHQVIYQELCMGEISQRAKDDYLRIIEDLSQRGAGAVILGCTEIGLLVKQSDTQVPLLDTTHIHAETAVNLALSLKGE